MLSTFIIVLLLGGGAQQCWASVCVGAVGTKADAAVVMAHVSSLVRVGLCTWGYGVGRVVRFGYGTGILVKQQYRYPW